MNIEELSFLFLEIVNEIPLGKVSCYSDIAKKSGYPKNARLVGKILSNSELYGRYPCHRVVHKDGELVFGWTEQRSLLSMEGIHFLSNGKVDMESHRWN